MATSVRTIYEHKQRTRLKIKIAAIMVLLLSAGGAFAYLNWWENVFEFKEVVLEGVSSLSQGELLGGAGPISFFSSVRISHPAVAGIVLHRDYFRRVLRIEVKERERFGIWCVASCFWFDKEGALFAEAPRAEGALVRRVSDRTGRELSLGGRALPPERLVQLLRAFELLTRAGLSAGEATIEDLSREEVYVELLEGPRVIFSLRSDPTFAYEPLLNLKDELPRIAYIDLRVDQRIFLKYK